MAKSLRRVRMTASLAATRSIDWMAFGCIDEPIAADVAASWTCRGRKAAKCGQRRKKQMFELVRGAGARGPQAIG